MGKLKHLQLSVVKFGKGRPLPQNEYNWSGAHSQTTVAMLLSSHLITEILFQKITSIDRFALYTKSHT